MATTRLLLGLMLLVALVGCAADAGAGTQRIELDGRITEVVASAGDRSYVLEVEGLGLLPLDVSGRPPRSASGVVVEVPDSLSVPDEARERFAVLEEFARDTDGGLPVVDFL